MIDAIVFDLDGVLVDSEAISCGATADLLARLGFELDTEGVRRLFLGKPIEAVYEHYRQVTGRALPASFGAEKEALYIERARGTLQAMPGAHALLEELRGKVKLAIASSGSPGKVAFSLAETELAGMFEVICTSTEVANGKPAPDLFLLAASRLNVDPSRCAVIEDSIPGVEAGVAAGMLTIGFTSSLSKEALRKAGADDVIDRLEQLRGLA